MMTTTQAPSRILIVDDESGIRYYLQRVLARDGHEVVMADSGEAALKCIATQEFDLALVDLKMTGVNGLQVLAAMRRQWPETPVIVLTAHASLETAIEALRQDAHDYLFKPSNTVEIRESVRSGLLKRREALRRREPPPSAPDSTLAPRETVSLPDKLADEGSRFLRHQGLIADLARHVVTVDGHLLDLTLTEFRLVTHLLDQFPRVVPPIELVREVQGYDSESLEARETVRSHIYHIRRKIKAATGRDMIYNVRGVGYTFAE
jgi:DNA-binding response OmpR family regulator